jgi:hypothetical protein
VTYYVLYDTASGQILAVNTTGFTPGTGEAVLGPLSSADTTACPGPPLRCPGTSIAPTACGRASGPV